MRVAFRVDGNNKIGIGHIMRCLSLADAFAQHDVHVEFVLSDTIMQEIVERRGYSTYLLNSRWDDYSYGLSEFRTLLVDHSINWVITDSYYAQQEYFAEIHDFCKTAIISEDVPAAELCHVDLFINYNIYMNSFKPDHHNYKMCLGSDYALLRSEYALLPENQGDQILVLTGGSDPLNVAPNIVNGLYNKFQDKIKIAVVTSSLNPHLTELELLCGKRNVTVYVDTADMASVMQKAKVAISAGGSTLYELCACGVPTITYSFVDNQLGNVNAYSQKNLMPYAGDFRCSPESVVANIVSACEDYLNGSKHLKEISQKLRILCDGAGAMRVAREIIKMSGN